MKTRTIILPLLAAFALGSSGCVGTGPNTQQGAVSGAALGALAGAIIGNNSGGNGASGAAIGAAAGAIMGGTMGNAADHERGTVYGGGETASASTTVVQSVPAMPAPRQEVVVVQPDPEAIWVQGYWEYEPRGYVWIAGHWEVPPRHYRYYVPPHWARHQHGGYVYVRGTWQ
ncbi:MAG: YXWGXW repeat-containing protein [Opitutae bacterium]|nr:YXWGXW repeat-containing protein [Opitutae bacterium]